LRNCGDAVAEQHSLKSCGITIAEALPSGCGVAIADSKNCCACPPLVFNVSLENTEELDAENMKHIAGINKVSYTGTAEISPEIIDAGLEIPNLIHKTPEEALNLDLFEPDVRPYLRDLFFKKYRGLVSLHPMDAGEISNFGFS
jgi:hypothetical protein